MDKQIALIIDARQGIGRAIAAKADSLAGGIRKQAPARIPGSRFGRREEVAAAVVFLRSDPATCNTGAVLNLNGGVYT